MTTSKRWDGPGTVGVVNTQTIAQIARCRQWIEDLRASDLAVTDALVAADGVVTRGYGDSAPSVGVSIGGVTINCWVADVREAVPVLRRLRLAGYERTSLDAPGKSASSIGTMTYHYLRGALKITVTVYVTQAADARCRMVEVGEETRVVKLYEMRCGEEAVKPEELDEVPA